MATYGHTFTSGDTLTPTKLNNARTVTDIVNADVSASAEIHASKLAGGSILDAQINSDAAIELSKLATGALPAAITVASANLVDGTIATADIANEAVTTAKIAPSTIIGSVAQSGGLATGSLFETGNNGIYGTWLKLADGTMFCWVVQVSGTWFFPVPFVSAPQVVFGTAGSASAGPVCMFSNVLNDRCTVYVQNTNPAAAAPSTGASWLAIGRWF
jgi:hypothetical protein